VGEKFTLKEIAKLIKLCKTNDVSSLKVQGLEISIGATASSPMTPNAHARGSAKKALEVEEKGSLQEQMNLAERVIETMHVEDPAAFEAMLISRELGEEKNN
jgi:hypothetical protein